MRLAEIEATSARSVRWDIVTRYAILRPHSGRAQLCLQSNGRRKAGYRTQAVAEHVAWLLGLVEGGRVYEVYRCHQADGIRRMGEHFHIHTPGVDTHRDDG